MREKRRERSRGGEEGGKEGRRGGEEGEEEGRRDANFLRQITFHAQLSPGCPLKGILPYTVVQEIPLAYL